MFAGFFLVVAVECRSWLRARRGARRLERLLSEMERETVAGTGPAQEIRKCDPQHPLVGVGGAARVALPVA